ncbi:MAG: amidohydrolase family protein [Polyangiales bacterium]
MRFPRPLGSFFLFAVLLTVPACGGDDAAPEGEVDSGGSDDGVDATIDSARPDLGVDSGSDLGTDSAPDGADARDAADAPSDSGDSGDSGTPITPLFPGDAGCVVTKGDADKFLITGVALLRPAPLAAGEVLVVADKIACAGASCSAETGAATATKIACTSGIVLPGYVDAHNHVDWNPLPNWKHAGYYEDRYQWRGSSEYTAQIVAAHNAIGGALECPAVLYSEVRAIVGGTTSIQGTSVSSGALPCISKLVRNVDLGGTAAGLGVNIADTDINPVTSVTSAKSIRDKLAAGTTIAYIAHVGEGYDRAQRAEFDIEEGHQLFGSKSAFIHTAGAHAREYTKMAATGTKLIWSPRSNLDLYGDTAHVSVARKLGVQVALGCDWSPSGSWQVPEEMRCAYEVDQSGFGATLTEDDVVAMTTSIAADAVGVGDKVGRLEVGMIADLQIVSGDKTKPAHSAIQAGPNETALVFVGGKPVYGESTLLDAVVTDATLCDAVPLCTGVNKKVCLKTAAADDSLAAVTKKLADALAAKKASAKPEDQFMFEVAPFAHCTKPFTCKLGNKAYPGVAATGDADGDTIADATDNCPALFNPLQDDWDGDAKGDECDECPNKAGADCGLTDLDSDGTPNATDVCPFTTGTTASVCAPCGTTTTACSISDSKVLRDPSTPIRLEIGANAALNDLTIVGQWKSGTNTGTFLQANSGASYGGMFVFRGTGTASTLNVGDVVNVSGQMTIFDGIYELQNATSSPLTMTATGTTKTLTPMVVDVRDVWTGGPRNEELFGQLIELHDLVVRADTLFAEVVLGDEAGAFGGTIRLQGTAMGLGNPACAGATFTKPAVGTKYAKIVGVLDRRNSVAKILPRCPTDLVTK